MMSFLFLVGLMQASTDLAESKTQAPPNVLFSFYRARAFHDRAHNVGCDAKPQVSLIDERFEKLRAKLISRFDAKDFTPKPDQPRENGDCTIIQIGYDHAVSEAEQAAGK